MEEKVGGEITAIVKFVATIEQPAAAPFESLIPFHETHYHTKDLLLQLQNYLKEGKWLWETSKTPHPRLPPFQSLSLRAPKPE